MTTQTSGFVVSDETIKKLEQDLLNQSIPIPERFRTIFTLKSLMSDKAVSVLCKALTKTEPSDLLKHEVGYCLGQMGLNSALPTLERILCDSSEHDMVRHEAGEALGAIANPKSLPILEKFQNDPIDAVRETCQIAIDRIKWVMEQQDPSKKEEKNYQSELYLSVDPAPPMSPTTPISTLSSTFLNTSLPLFLRYRALFSLRELGTSESVEIMVKGLADASALFRHEVAYVLGQVQHPQAVTGLIEVLKRGAKENEMVRHEAAEALGSIAEKSGVKVLRKCVDEIDSQIVRQSIYVALDIADYTNSDEFQYAKGLESSNNNSEEVEVKSFKNLQEKKQ